MSKKRETVWRDKLVRLFKERNPNGFIWVNGSLFKQGFPDLTIIREQIATHIELKIAASLKSGPFKNLSQRQEQTCLQIVRAGGRAYCLSLAEKERQVVSYNFQGGVEISRPLATFESVIWGRQTDL